jgi:polyphosphate kinase
VGINLKQNRFINRELSLFEFHKRVLENAFDVRHPLFSRLMFLSIASKNLDEFYTMNFAMIQTKINNGKLIDEEGYNLKEIAGELVKRTYDFSDRINHGVLEILKELENEHVYVKKIEHLNEVELSFLENHFHSHIKPFLTPTILDSTHPLPLIPNGSLTLICKLASTHDATIHYMVIVLTPYVNRLIRVSKNPLTYVTIENVIEYFLPHFLPLQSVVEDIFLIKPPKNNNISIEEDIKTMSLNPGGIAKKRRSGNIVKIFTTENISHRMQKFLMHTFHISSDDIVKVRHYLAVGNFYHHISSDRPDLSYQSLASRFPKRIKDFDGDYFRAISEKDIIMHHPFESFEVFLGFLHQAATDPNVLLIKQTLYRTNSDSRVVKELITAAENGKHVVVLIELRASMDEENNIYLAKTLEESGIQVVYGNLNLKTHAKICLVVKKNGEEIQEFLHIGTGNYHPINAKMYTDFSLFTTSPVFCREANDVFNYITGLISPPHSSMIWISPINLKEKLLYHIDQEIQHKKAGKPAGIWMKCNSLTDRDIIEALYAASKAGVPCQLVVRGMCCLRPGISGLSSKIKVKSIVGVYLEHSRMYCFASGEPLPSLGNKVYISSADLMKRNLDHRVEVMVDIENPTVRKQLIDEIFFNYLHDTQNSWIMKQDGTYQNMKQEKTSPEGVQLFDVHEYFAIHESISGRSTRF